MCDLPACIIVLTNYGKTCPPEGKTGRDRTINNIFRDEIAVQNLLIELEVE
jgi:hypothetical protein